jgi:flavin-dependent dehydrogenase
VDWKLLLSDFSNPVDVFVVGGGPAGLAVAIASRKRGLSVIVADGAIPPIDKPCGEGLMPDGLDALRELGIEIPAEEVYPFRGIRFVSGAKRAEAVFPRGLAYGIRRTALHRILIDHAASCGVSMLWQSAVTGLHPDGVMVGGKLVHARSVVGADGSSSRVRRWAGLDGHRKKNLRFGFRRHYRIAPWTDFMELHWGDCQSDACQIYVTPVGREEICVALISASPHLRLDAALTQFPELVARLGHAEHASTERGAITVSRTLQRVYRGKIALVGDASGGVDAITGEGLCLAFRQAALLADCLAERNLARYQVEHRRLIRRPALMARLMLLMGSHGRVRQCTMQVFESIPRSFAAMLALHVGDDSAHGYIASGIALGRQILKT